MNTEDYVLRVLSALEAVDRRLVGWHTEGPYAPVTFFVDVTGVFDWVTPTLVMVGREDVAELERAISDVRATCGGDVSVGVLLYASRTRVMRPMHARYPRDSRAWSLFDAAGAERPDDDSARPGKAWQVSRGRHAMGPVTGEYPTWDDATATHPIAHSGRAWAA